MLTNDIKEYALSIGYTGVGITSADGFPEYVEEVASRGDKYDIFGLTTFNPVLGARPKDFMPEAKSIIVLVLDYFQQDFPDELKKMIGKIYLARCYMPHPGLLAHSRAQLMKDFLSGRGCRVNADIGIPARWAAAQAGVTTFGKNNFAYAKGSGSYIVISTIVVDAELDYDRPTMDSKCPADCQACLKACPTGAIYEPYKLNPFKCIGFNHWITQEGRGAISPYIDPELREGLGCKIHGCDICQDVCPRNQKKLKAPKPVDRYIERLGADYTLPAFLNLTDEFFARRVRPVMYNYIKDKRYFMRNAAVALGNTRNPEYAGELAAAMLNPDELIREHAAWALGRIGGTAAKAALEKAAVREESSRVRPTIDQALARL